MNYMIEIIDGQKKWVRLVYNKQTNKIDKNPIDANLQLNPNNYFDGDEVSINSNPPSEPGNCIPFEELLEVLKTEYKNHKPQPGPWIYYCKDSPGQAIEVTLNSEPSIAEWQNPHLTIKYSAEDRNKITGFRIENLMGLKLKQEADIMIE